MSESFWPKTYRITFRAEEAAFAIDVIEDVLLSEGIDWDLEEWEDE